MKKLTKGLKKAFTITELVIVIAVIAILAAVLIPTFSSVIGSARESAAMQECRNALTNYSAEAEKEGISTTGMVFVNNDYVYVNLNGTLQLLGDIDDLAYMGSDGAVHNYDDFTESSTAITSKVSGFEVSNYSSTDTKGIKITIKDEGGKSQAREDDKPIVLEQEVDAKRIDTINNPKGVVHEVENLYLYYIKLNDTEYVGYFTLEMESSEGASEKRYPQFTANEGEVRFSRAFGFISLIGEASITFANPNPGIGG